MDKNKINNIEETIYPSKIIIKKLCYCCQKEKEGIYIIKNNSKNPKKEDLRFVCNDCNHLKSEDNKEI